MPGPVAKRLLLAGEGLMLTVATVATAAAASLAVRGTGFIPAGAGPLLSALLFLGATAVLLGGPAKAVRRSVRLRAWLPAAAAAAALFALATLPPGAAGPGLVRAAGIIFVLAAVEEAVFRGMLPRRLAVLARAGWGRRSALAVVAAPFLAQAAFAACHLAVAAPHLPASAHVEGARLLAAGLLYWILAARYGLWLSTGVHAALNFRLLYGTDFMYSAVPFPELVLTALVVLAGLAWTRSPSAPRRHDRRPVRPQSLAAREERSVSRG